MSGMCISRGGPRGGCENCEILDTCWVILPWTKERALRERAELSGGQQDKGEIIEALQKISNSEKECEIAQIEVWLKKKSKLWFKARQRSVYDYI
jgi:hypothetical protein